MCVANLIQKAPSNLKKGMKIIKSVKIIILFLLLFLTSCSHSKEYSFISKRSLVYNEKAINIKNEIYNENIITTKNEDGTLTLNVFSSPAYINMEGTNYQICDNSFVKTVEDSEYMYSNKINDVKTFLPQNLTSKSGIKIAANMTEMDISLESVKSDVAKKSKI